METIHPTLYDMSLDYLPIQASAVLSEWVFSSSRETDTDKRSWINPVLMESLQMLKYALKRHWLDFMEGWVTDEKLMCIDADQGSDLLGEMLGDDFETTFDKVLAAVAEDDDADSVVLL